MRGRPSVARRAKEGASADSVEENEDTTAVKPWSFISPVLCYTHPMSKSPKITIETLAEMSQREFSAVRSEMDSGFRKVHEDNSILRRDMEAGFHGLSSGMKIIIGQLKEIREDVIELHDLRSRIERLEKKMGLSK